jgi:hypothetical protein
MPKFHQWIPLFSYYTFLLLILSQQRRGCCKKVKEEQLSSESAPGEVFFNALTNMMKTRMVGKAAGEDMAHARVDTKFHNVEFHLLIPSPTFSFLLIPSPTFAFLRLPSHSFAYLLIPSPTFSFLRLPS